jgi:hypothetical protein
VVIYGAGFIGQNETAETSAVWVRFNATETGELGGTVKASSVGINEIALQTPAGAVGSSALLSVSKNNIDFMEIRGVGRSNQDDYYTYYDAPHVLSLDPSNGPVKNGPSELLVQGENFYCFDNNCDRIQ